MGETTTSTKTGVSVRCTSGLRSFGHCTSFDGLRSKAPKRAKCAYCGGSLSVTETVWAPVDHRGDGRYVRPGATYPTPEAASEAATWEQVVRSFSPHE